MSCNLVLEIDKHYEVIVDEIVSFGAVVQILGTSETALIHISKLSDKFVRDISHIVKVGDTLDAICVRNDKTGKLELSVKHMGLGSSNKHVNKPNKLRSDSNIKGRKSKSDKSDFEKLLSDYNKQFEDNQRSLKYKPKNRKRHQPI